MQVVKSTVRGILEIPSTRDAWNRLDLQQMKLNEGPLIVVEQMHVGVEREVGQNIKANRKRLGLTQETLAERCNMHPVEVGRAERGVRDLRVLVVRQRRVLVSQLEKAARLEAERDQEGRIQCVG